MTSNKKLLQERHSDLVNMTVRGRIMIEGKDDPTVLDIMTDMRALPGIVTVRQMRPISDPVTPQGKRIIEMKVSYMPQYVEGDGKLMTVLKSIKTVEGLDMLKVIEHDNQAINNQIKETGLVL